MIKPHLEEGEMRRPKMYRTAARLLLAIAMSAGLLGTLMPVWAATYSFTDLNSTGIISSYGFGISGTKQVGGYGPFDQAYEPDSHALLWSGTAGSVVDLHPSGFDTSSAKGICGNQQVGYGTFWSNTDYGFVAHALIWSNTTASVADLHPPGFAVSVMEATSGAQQVGWGYGVTNDISTNHHALLWSGTAESAVDLHPSGYVDSRALGVGGNRQVGWGDGAYHALLWSGTASSVVDLTPSGSYPSKACATTGSQQVGQRNGHAMLWSGTAASAVDLHPSGFELGSIAIAISGNQQAGWGGGSASGGRTHALLWSGTPDSVVDLHTFLSSDYSDSQAQGIDSNGNIIGEARYIPTGQYHAILWTVRPRLEITQSGQNVVLFWSSNAFGFAPQSALNLYPPINWTDITDAPTIIGTQWTVTNTISNTFQFYRLKK